MFQLNAQLVSAVRGPEQKQRERCVRAGKERPHARATVRFRCIIFATSRIHKKHVQPG